MVKNHQTTNTLASARLIHFIGIGGIGVSYLAQWCLARGCRVSGSDIAEGPIVEILREKGAKIRVGAHRGKNIPKGTELVIYTLAARPSNPERREARRRGIAQISHAEALGELTERYATIAIAGSHGKSTTTALTGLLLKRAGFNPTVFVGTKLKEFGGTNCAIGRSKYLVIEADEWHGAFWHYRPHIVILTNIDREHLDFYKDFRGVKSGFKKFLAGTPHDAIIVANGDDPAVREAVIDSSRTHIFYSRTDPDADRVRRILRIPGSHNVSNALAVLTLSRVLRIPRYTALRTIANYRGSWRRFEYRGMLRGAKLFDDYAHHPTEITATLSAGRTILWGAGRLWCVFQPHQYRRLQALFPAFVRAFDQADHIVVLPVYAVAGRESPQAFGVRAEHLSEALAQRGLRATYAPSFRRAAAILHRDLRRGDICILMGAGDIVRIHEVLHTT
jgi:UDP-N-acetylmuramate--alanine ligase